MLVLASSMSSAATPPQAVPAVAEVIAAVEAARMGLNRLDVEAELVASSGTIVRTRLALDGDAARWTRSIIAAASGVSAFDAMSRDGVGVIVRPAQAGGSAQAMIADPSWLMHPKGEVPGVEYFRYLRWSPIDQGVDATFGFVTELLDGPVHVRAEQESVHGVDCWIVDRFMENGQITASYWIAPSRSWLPARQVLWNGGEAVQVVEVTTWHQLENGYHIPREGMINHLDGAESEAMALVIRDDGSVAATCQPSLPLAATDIVPADASVWDARQAVALSSAPELPAICASDSVAHDSGLGRVVAVSCASLTALCVLGLRRRRLVR